MNSKKILWSMRLTHECRKWALHLQDYLWYCGVIIILSNIPDLCLSVYWEYIDVYKDSVSEFLENK